MAEPLQYNDELLMKYIDGELSPAEASAIESKMQTDVELKERVERLKLSVSAIRYFGTSEKVRSLHTEMMQELKPAASQGRVVTMSRSIRYGIAIAASIILIVAGFNWYNNSRISPEKLYNEAYVDYDASGTRGTEQPTAVENFYNNRDYKSVIQQKSNALTSRDSLLVGISYLKTDDPASAANWLRAMSNSTEYKKDSDFYLSLAYLKTKNYKAAAALMNAIAADPQHPYNRQFSDKYIRKVESMEK